MTPGGEAGTVGFVGVPATSDTLGRDLAALGVARGDLLLVHTALSSMRWVCGGAVAVIDALANAVGPEGTLVMPAHSAGLTEPSTWCNPPVPKEWWKTIRATMPAFDRRVTPTRRMGAVAELFRTLPGVKRSDHPTSSFAAKGRLAGRIVRSQPLDDPMGEKSPLGVMARLGGKVLLLGVGHERNTSLHFAERLAFGDAHATIENGSPVLIDGVRHWILYEEPLLDSNDFAALGAAFERQTQQVTIGQVGAAEARLMDQRLLVLFGADWLRENRKPDGTPNLA